MHIELYDDSRKRTWDEFVRRSKNGTFLFSRDYMDYHRDRFADYSLMIEDSGGHPIALLPANRDGTVLVSHGGLTYGGFVCDEGMKTPLMLEALERTLAHLKRQGYETLIYKAVPYIYHLIPAEEDRYALFRCGAELFRRDISTVVLPARSAGFQQRRRRSIRKAQRTGITCGRSQDYESFWQLVSWVLTTFHDREPVHTLTEIVRLRERFPENIELFGAWLGDAMIAGVLVYVTPRVAHVQYNASSKVGRSLGALDLLIYYLLTDVFKNKEFLDLGISTEDEGQFLNEGLINYKEGFGGRAVVYDCYRLDV